MTPYEALEAIENAQATPNGEAYLVPMDALETILAYLREDEPEQVERRYTSK